MIQSYPEVRVWWGKGNLQWVVQTPDLVRHLTSAILFDNCVVVTQFGESPSEPEAYLLIRNVVVDHNDACSIIVPDKTAGVPAVKEHKPECATT